MTSTSMTCGQGGSGGGGSGCSGGNGGDCGGGSANRVGGFDGGAGDGDISKTIGQFFFSFLNILCFMAD